MSLPGLFLSGVGAHFKGTIEEHTKHVLDELEKRLIGAGSSMEKVLKASVYLNDINDWARMNTVWAGGEKFRPSGPPWLQPAAFRGTRSWRSI